MVLMELCYFLIVLILTKRYINKLQNIYINYIKLVLMVGLAD